MPQRIKKLFIEQMATALERAAEGRQLPLWISPQEIAHDNGGPAPMHQGVIGLHFMGALRLLCHDNGCAWLPVYDRFKKMWRVEGERSTTHAEAELLDALARTVDALAAAAQGDINYTGVLAHARKMLQKHAPKVTA